MKKFCYTFIIVLIVGITAALWAIASPAHAEQFETYNAYPLGKRVQGDNGSGTWYAYNDEEDEGSVVEKCEDHNSKRGKFVCWGRITGVHSDTGRKRLHRRQYEWDDYSYDNRPRHEHRRWSRKHHRSHVDGDFAAGLIIGGIAGAILNELNDDEPRYHPEMDEDEEVEEDVAALEQGEQGAFTSIFRPEDGGPTYALVIIRHGTKKEYRVQKFAECRETTPEEEAQKYFGWMCSGEHHDMTSKEHRAALRELLDQ